MAVGLDLLERWLNGWSLARGLPLPARQDGGLVVDVGWPDQLRRHVFADAGEALSACAAQVREAHVHVKAPVAPEALMRALPAHWQFEQLRYLMSAPPASQVPATLPPGYRTEYEQEHGARLLRVRDAQGEQAAIGRIALHKGTAVFDRIETSPNHRRQGLASYIMLSLDAIASEAHATERLLVATEEGRQLYERLGWQLLAPYSTAFTSE